jgi:hypothetical protein
LLFDRRASSAIAFTVASQSIYNRFTIALYSLWNRSTLASPCNRTGSALRSHCNRTAIELRSHCNRTSFVSHSHCKRTVFVSHSHCNRTAISLESLAIALRSPCETPRSLSQSLSRFIIGSYSLCTLVSLWNRSTLDSQCDAVIIFPFSCSPHCIFLSENNRLKRDEARE